jgi:hypothetical protein
MAGGGGGGGGGGAAPKQDDLTPHPVKDQLPGVSYCITSPPPWREYPPLPDSLFLLGSGETSFFPSSPVRLPPTPLTHVVVGEQQTPVAHGGERESAEFRRWFDWSRTVKRGWLR